MLITEVEEWWRWRKPFYKIGRGNLLGRGTDTSADLFQVGGSIMHKPSGLGIYGMYQAEETGGENFVQTADPNLTGMLGDQFRFAKISNPDTNAWYVKPFWRWSGGRERGGPRHARRDHLLRRIRPV